MADVELDPFECLGEHMYLWRGDATSSHLSGRNVEETGSEIQNSNAIRIPEDTRGDVDVQGERSFAAKVDRLDDSATEFDDFEFFAVGVSISEKLPSDRNERECWTDGDEVIEKIHCFENHTGGPCLLRKVLLDHTESEGCGITECERNFSFPAGDLDSEVIDLDFAPRERATYKMSEMKRKRVRYRRKRICPFQISTKVELERIASSPWRVWSESSYRREVPRSQYQSHIDRFWYPECRSNESDCSRDDISFQLSQHQDA